MINRVEDETFTKLTNLEVLDLSGNSLDRIPPEIFNLNSLRNLYLADLRFADRQFETTLNSVDKPIKAPLNLLSIASNRLTRIPDFGVLPYLHRLNISHNNMRDLTMQQLSPFCQLKLIDLTDTDMDKCQCSKLLKFLFVKREADLSRQFFCDEDPASKRFTLNSTRRWHNFLLDNFF